MNSLNPCTGKCDWTGVVESTQPTTGNVERYPMCKACGSFVVGSAALSAPVEAPVAIFKVGVECEMIRTCLHHQACIGHCNATPRPLPSVEQIALAYMVAVYGEDHAHILKGNNGPTWNDTCKGATAILTLLGGSAR